jgi:hypothetical protein
MSVSVDRTFDHLSKSIKIAQPDSDDGSSLSAILMGNDVTGLGQCASHGAKPNHAAKPHVRRKPHFPSNTGIGASDGDRCKAFSILFAML